MTIEHWAPPCQERSPWDTVYLDDIELPGIARVTCGLAWENAKGKPEGGSLGATTFKGEKHPDVSVALRLDTEEELQQFERVRPMLRPRTAKGELVPHRIRHPHTQAWGIAIITIDSVSSAPPTVNDGWEITLTCSEWAKGAKKVKTAKADPKPGPMTEDGSGLRLSTDGFLMESTSSNNPLPGSGATLF